jgi:hypothetical protein
MRARAPPRLSRAAAYSPQARARIDVEYAIERRAVPRRIAPRVFVLIQSLGVGVEEAPNRSRRDHRRIVEQGSDDGRSLSTNKAFADLGEVFLHAACTDARRHARSTRRDDRDRRRQLPVQGVQERASKKSDSCPRPHAYETARTPQARPRRLWHPPSGHPTAVSFLTWLRGAGVRGEPYE